MNRQRGRRAAMLSVTAIALPLLSACVDDESSTAPPPPPPPPDRLRRASGHAVLCSPRSVRFDETELLFDGMGLLRHSHRCHGRKCETPNQMFHLLDEPGRWGVHPGTAAPNLFF